MDRIKHIFSFEVDALMFNQLNFWIFFLAVMILFSLLHQKKWMKSLFLTVVSLFFYYKTSGLSVVILGASLLVNYGLALQFDRFVSTWSRKTVLTLGVLFNILILAYFKYAYFFTESFNEMFHTQYEVFNIWSYWKSGVNEAGTSVVEKIIVPAGVSFFTFTSIAYLVDVHRKEVKSIRNFFDFTLFSTFFPHIILGPIAKAKDFVPQINMPYELDKTDFSWAIAQIVKGLIKKLILADYIAVHFINKVVDHPEEYPGFVSIVAMWGYSLQIYGDFSGYIDMARGISRLMGFKLMKNFNAPYKAINVADFWRRWHISLGSWWRNYLYIPLGGNKTGGVGTYVGITIIVLFLVFITQWYELIFIYIGTMAFYLIGMLIFPGIKKYVHRDLNLLITMVVGGLWHNPEQNFVIWGAMNGLALVIFNHWKKISPYENSTKWIAHAWKIFLTFNFITFTRIWFRLTEDHQPLEMLHHIGTKFNFSVQAFGQMCHTFSPALIIIVLGMTVHWLPTRLKDRTLAIFTSWHIVFQLVAVAFAILLTYQMISEVSKPVYFVF